MYITLPDKAAPALKIFELVIYKLDSTAYMTPPFPNAKLLLKIEFSIETVLDSKFKLAPFNAEQA